MTMLQRNRKYDDDDVDNISINNLVQCAMCTPKLAMRRSEGMMLNMSTRNSSNGTSVIISVLALDELLAAHELLFRQVVQTGAGRTVRTAVRWRGQVTC